MKKRLQSGIALLETVLLIVIVGLVAFVVWYAFHTKNSTDNTLNGAANTQQSVPPKKSASSNSTSTTTQVVTTKTDSKGIQYLADSSGKTLYTYGADSANTSNCTGSCLSVWPAYKATASSASLPTNVGTITRSDGSLQYTYKQMPLYYYSGDTAAGQINGNGVGNFSVAKP